MGDKTGIQWTDASWNPIVGCSIVSPGCRLCYAMGEAARQIRCAAGLKRETHYAGTVETKNGRPIWTGKIAAAPDHIWEAPLRWRRPRRIFVNSMSDLFHEDVPKDWIDRAFATMAMAPRHTFQILTKRSDRMRRYLNSSAVRERIGEEIVCRRWPKASIEPALIWEAANEPAALDRWPLPNVWLGVSTERQREADQRIPDLLATPAAVRFISAEPLLGPIDLARYLVPSMHVGPTEKPLTAEGARAIAAIGRAVAKKMGAHFLDWVIAGGESSRLNAEHPHPMHPEWARSLRDQCAAAGVPFFFKQWGEWLPGHHYTDELKAIDSCLEQSRFACMDWNGDRSFETEGLAGWDDLGPDAMWRVGTAKAGRLLDGREHNDFPNDGGDNGAH